LGQKGELSATVTYLSIDRAWPEQRQGLERSY